MTPIDQLRADLAAARERVAGKTLAEAPELFKDIEGIKVCIWTQGRKRPKSAIKCDGQG